MLILRRDSLYPFSFRNCVPSLESCRYLYFEMLSLMIIASVFFVASGSTINNETKGKEE